VRKRVDDRPATGKIFDLQVTSVKREGDVATQAAVALLYDVSRLEQLESVRRTFVADVSHELRTPLTSIKAAVEMLIDDSELDRVRADRFLSMIERHAGRMEALIDDLSDLSKIETGAVSLDKREVELSLLVRKVLDDLAQRASEYGIALRDEVPVGLTLVADPRRLEQMLVNLVDNAIKFSRERGAVAVRAGKDGERTVIEVEDTGIGIPSDSLERVFNRFFRVDEARSRETGGTGLGLSIVKHLMQLHGGRVRVESELGSGSRFILEF
jgi:two-component system phosphate regulon sensor histidine kinase PhoR